MTPPKKRPGGDPRPWSDGSGGVCSLRLRRGPIGAQDSALLMAIFIRGKTA